jgi:hypothetical protein
MSSVLTHAFRPYLLTPVDRSSSSYLPATQSVEQTLWRWYRDGSGKDKEVGTNPREGKVSRGEGVAEIGNRLLKYQAGPNLNQPIVTLLADSEGGRADFVNCEVRLRSLLM